MSWEHDHYKVTCKKCRSEGRLHVASDDWNRFESHWEGFDEIRAYQMNHFGSRGRCGKCGSEEIEISILDSNDSKGLSLSSASKPT